MATKEEMEAVVEIQRLAMTISSQGNYRFHTAYWGHTDEIKIWASSSDDSGRNIAGWDFRDHSYYLGDQSSDDSLFLLQQTAYEMKSKFLIVDEDGIPL